MSQQKPAVAVSVASCHVCCAQNKPAWIPRVYCIWLTVSMALSQCIFCLCLFPAPFQGRVPAAAAAGGGQDCACRHRAAAGSTGQGQEGGRGGERQAGQVGWVGVGNTLKDVVTFPLLILNLLTDRHAG